MNLSFDAINQLIKFIANGVDIDLYLSRKGYLKAGQNKCLHLSWGTLTKLSPFAVERDSFDLVLKPSEDSGSFRVTLSQLEKPFKYLTKFSCNFLEPLIFKCNFYFS